MGACYLALFNPEAAQRCFEKAKQLSVHSKDQNPQR
jgi:hypothetical protein